MGAETYLLYSIGFIIFAFMKEKKGGRGGARKGAGAKAKGNVPVVVYINRLLVLKHGADTLRKAFINTANNLK